MFYGSFQAEDDLLKRQIEMYNHRLKDLEEHHSHHLKKIQQF